MAAERRRRSQPELESLEEQLDREAMSSDLLDVPAAVVCVLCGQADCPGCEHDPSRSGIVAIVAWERPAMPMLTRLWSTARSTTRDAEGFFELLPDGPVLPALRFAAMCELFAASAVFVLVLGVTAILAPEWLKHLLLDPHARGVALRVAALGVPAFAALLVLAHAAHGLSIDLGATKNGGRPARSRALRFGLYACGWDLVIGPIGAVVVAIKEGASAALGIAALASEVPGKSTRAFLRGCYRLDGDRAKAASATAWLGAVVATGVFVVVILAAMVVLALA
jgi:hypothetical protein